MNKQAYNTGTIELMPYSEHGEFCIVGVFAVNAERRELSYKIMETQKTRRLTGFFPEMKRNIFTQTLKSIHDEWSALTEMVNTGRNTPELAMMDKLAGSDLLNAITYPREGIIRHKERGAIITNNIDEWLNKAFTKMVLRRELSTILPEEQRLTQQVGNYLKELKLKRYWKEKKVGNDIYHAHFPFTYTPVGQENVERAIKPLYLGQETSTKIMDHGDTWLQKVRRLNQFEMRPETLIFPVELPADLNSEQYAHAAIVTNDLQEEGVKIVEDMNIEIFRPLLSTDVVSDTPLFAREG